MKGKPIALIAAALAVIALTLYAYRELPARPFAADDYQWLLNVHGLSFGQLVRRAFDPGAQSHFFRPLVWLLFWAQTRAFGLDPRGFHAASLGLHLLNASLLGWLFYRLANGEGRRTNEEQTAASSALFGVSAALVVSAIVALHPAPFEAVVWISAQSELLAAALLLAALHLWLPRQSAKDQAPKTNQPASYALRSSIFGPWSLLATLALGLALLAKESAVIGLPLLALIGLANIQGSHLQACKSPNFRRLAPYLLPALVTLAYVALQVAIERRNYLLEQGGYGLGAQLALNPLRSLALILAPLPGTEHADAGWLVPVGAAVAVVLLIILIGDLRLRMLGRGDQSSAAAPGLSAGVILALGLTLLPTAPFVSPPDSRYLYLPVLAAGLFVPLLFHQILRTKDQRPTVSAFGPWSLVLSICVLSVAWWASGELHIREWRFATASGPGGSLWRVAAAVCADSRPDRMVIVEPPLAPPHAEAIVGLACGDATRARIVGRDQIDDALKGHSVVIAFQNGSAEIERRT
jgi:hypothetical protein